MANTVTRAQQHLILSSITRRMRHPLSRRQSGIYQDALLCLYFVQACIRTSLPGSALSTLIVNCLTGDRSVS